MVSVANEDLRERVRQAVMGQKRPTVTVLSSLLAAQDALGYIPDEAIDEVARVHGVEHQRGVGVGSVVL